MLLYIVASAIGGALLRPAVLLPRGSPISLACSVSACLGDSVPRRRSRS